MKGTAIIFQEENVMFIEDVDISIYKELKDQCGCSHCTCKIENKVVDFGMVSPVFWHENDVEWDYGY